MPSSFSRILIEVQYILGTYYLWNWIDFCHQLHPSMAKQLRVMDHFVCHSMVPKTQNMPIFISQVCIPLFFHQDKRSRGIITYFHIIRNNINTSPKHFTFILYPYVFSFVTSRSFWNAVICPAWRYWTIAVMEYECHLGGDVFLHCHCAATNSAEHTGQEGNVIRRTYLPRSDLSYPRTQWHDLTIN